MSQSIARATEEPDLPRAEAMRALLEDARKRLLETGTRNRLVHVNRDNQRANALNVINERSDDLYAILRQGGRKMRFKAIAPDAPEESEDGLPLLTEHRADEPFDEARYTDDIIETPLTTDKLHKRLLRLSRDSRSAEEEQGINILYLALGFLTWYEDKSSAVPRHAPLVMLPVELVRNARTSTFDLIARDDDLVTNLPLQERLMGDFGIGLPEIEEDEAWTPGAYFDQVASVIAGRENWQIDREGQQLGFFSFAKLLMLRDLDPANWPGAGLLNHDVLGGLMVSGFEPEAPLFGREDRLDDRLEPADIIQVVDADASQTKVIEEVRAGRNLVVQGPPGTGKSQTITNIIAAAVHDGKRILFVAEKMAALDVVHRRLKQTGLSAACLELHSRNANKKAVLAELSRTLNMASAIPEMPSSPDTLKLHRDSLNAVSDLLHSPVPEHDFTPFQAMAEMVGCVGRGAPPPSWRQDHLAKLTAGKAREIAELIDAYTTALEGVGKRSDHPFAGTTNLTLQPTDLQRLKPKLADTAKATEDLVGRCQALSQTLGVAKPTTLNDVRDFTDMLAMVASAPEATASFASCVARVDKADRLTDALELGRAWADAKAGAKGTLTDAALTVETVPMRRAIIAATSSFFARYGRKYKTASQDLASVLTGPLPKTAAERLAIVDVIVDVQAKAAALDAERLFLERAFGEEWRAERTPFAEIARVHDWYLRLRQNPFHPEMATLRKLLSQSEKLRNMASVIQSNCAAIADRFVEVNAALSDLSDGDATTDFAGQDLTVHAATLSRMSAEISRYGEWVHLCRTAQILHKEGLSDLISTLDKGTLAADLAVQEFRYARAEAQWRAARAHLPRLDKLTTLERHRLVNAYREEETQRIDDTQKLILARHLEQMPRGAAGEMAFIRGEIGKKRAHKPIRKLIRAAGQAVQKIKPVFLMSPISVAQFLPPGAVQFDLLVIDEASQVRPEDALGAIARCEQIVVVGDQKQLPPTSFFDRMTGNLEENDEGEEILGGAARATELESVLSLCEARGLNRQMLEWHYRSRDPSLIRVSNVEFYESNLVLPPSPLQLDDSYGLKFNRVDGAYTSASRGSGRPGTNTIEAQALVEAVVNHAKDHPELSLGIVTFSVRQRDKVTELLEHARRSNTVLDDFLRDGKSEDVFVKNIENVQGDERDIIFISVGYGPIEPRGRLSSMSFGPVNGDGGERRLNVLFSRSRIRCEVFVSFDPGDIDLSRTTKDGPRVLKRFLEFAKTGQIDEKVPTGFLADSPFETDVAGEVRKLGYVVDHQVGSSGFLIDLGVKHPERLGQYMLAIECDGATYHSALWARERDRLRQDVLEGLGWRFHRIWSTDWFHRRPAEVERLRAALETAVSETEAGVKVSGANQASLNARASNDEDVDDPAEDLMPLDLPPISMPPYTMFSKTLRTSHEPQDVPIAQLAPLVASIVDVEGPIHTDEVARRLASTFGKNRAGARSKDIALKALKAAEGSPSEDVQSLGDFWCNAEQVANPPVRDRSQLDGTLLKAEMIAPLEILAAADLVKENNGAVKGDALFRAIAKVLGFNRLGSDLHVRISSVLS
ncbi:MAG: DUF3320 domain-containing protein [Pseudomonadota bacterium]